MFLTLFLACPLLLVSWYLGFSSLKFRITFGEWINQPKAIAFLICMALAASIVFIDLNTLLS